MKLKFRGKHTPKIRERKLNHLHGVGMAAERCSPPRHERCESRTGVILVPKAPAGLDEFARPREMQGRHGYDGMRR